MTKKNIFKVGEAWISPRGTIYRVVAANEVQATLRKGLQGGQRRHFRGIDATHGWKLYAKS